MNASRDEQPTASVLIVDDTPATLTLLYGIIRERGYKARPVPSGELALQAAAAHPPDLILLDIDMPAMNGFEVCERLKANPALQDIPVIFTTAMTDIADKVRAFSVGGVDYITKPFQVEEVHARVATHLELKRQRCELQASYDRLREIEALRDSLVHMLVHDLRSPLMVLTMSLELLGENAALDAEGCGDVEEAINAAKRIALMVDSVLDVNKLESNEMRLRLEECEVVALAREAVDSLSSLTEGRVLTLRQQSGELRTRLDRQMIFRVIQNLLVNALKFAPASEGRVVLELDREGDGIRIRITNNGPAIPAEYHERIFEKFGLVSEAGARKVFSTGLGLPFCKLAVEAHGGRIGVESEAGKGATFWVVLPGGLEPSTMGTTEAAGEGERLA